MENASKALIIAGAILLAISIIGIGMYVFQQASGAMSGMTMDPEKAAAFNQKFDSYLGENVKGTQVRLLVDTVRNHNIASQSDDSLLVTLSSKDGTGTDVSTLNSIKAGIKAGLTYKVSVEGNEGYDSKTGYIKTITIEQSK